MNYNLTLDEKLKLLTGKDTWHTCDFNGKLPKILMSDGPHGVRKHVDDVRTPATAFPNLSILGCSWDERLVKSVSSAIADECLEQNVDVLLAPGVNIKRSVLCGRNFEYFSEDPYLAGTLARGYINGVQDKGVGASLKHFAVNSYEDYRHHQNAEVDDRVLFDIYLKAFRIALDAKPYTVMCSYNLVNGVYASENKRLLEKILRDKFGFEGVIVSDWQAVKNRAKALKASLDIEMPYNSFSFAELKGAYEQGFITDEEINKSVERLLALIQKCVFNRENNKPCMTEQERLEVILNAELESAVLLKNQDNILPLNKNAEVDIFGSVYSACIAGGGSSKVVLRKPVKLLHEALIEKGINANEVFWFDQLLTGEYKIVCIGNNELIEAEGYDRTNLQPDITRANNDAVIKACEQSENVIVVIYTGGVIDVSSWIDKVKAVIYAGFGGECVNEAIYKILFGEANPCGKLAESWGKSLEQSAVNCLKESAPAISYTERYDIGYRYFDKHPENIRFAFGHGLSYSKFEYSNLKIEKIGDTDFTVSYDITNTSKTDGKEISQIYVSEQLSKNAKPIKDLVAYDKTIIPAGQTKTITIKLDKSAFECYNWALEDYYVENGIYTIMIGASSQDIKLKQKVEIIRDKKLIPSIDHRGEQVFSK